MNLKLKLYYNLVATFLIIFLWIKTGYCIENQHVVKKSDYQTIKYFCKFDFDRDTVFKIYTWGLITPFNSKFFIECSISIQKKYGFKYESIGGCLVPKKMSRKWMRHNRRVERKLNKRNGKDWYLAYKKDIENNCENKEDD